MKQFNRKHDVLFWYSNGEEWTFNRDLVRIPHKKLNTNKKGAAIAEPFTEKLRQEYLVKGKVPETWWPDFSPVGRIKRERTGYPTQKPLRLLERIIQASSNPEDFVLDPFCGCATTLIAAQKLERKWIGIDISEKAVELVKSRLRRELGLFGNVIHRTDIPTDRGGKRSPDIKHLLFGKQEGFCNGCGISFHFRNFTVDHIIPKDKGGTDTDDNLQLLCGYCNSVKGNRTQEYLLAKLTEDNVIGQESFKEQVLHDKE